MTNIRAAAAAIGAVAVLLTACGDEGAPSVAPSPSATALPTFQATQLTEIHADITARSAELKDAGADVALIKVDDAARVVVVALRGDVARGTQVLHARYPREALRIERGDVGFQ